MGHLDEGPDASIDAVDSQIRSLLERITGDSEIWASLSHDYKCQVFVGWFLHSANEMVALDTDVLDELTQRHL